MIGQALAMILFLVAAPAKAPPPDQPLDIVAVDTSDFPTVVVDFVCPPEYSAIEITEAMVDVDGATIDSVTRVDPAAVAMALVVDDRPQIDADAVAAQQSGAVELVRTAGEGLQIALATPSGMQTAFTSDQGATIARVAGITAGATSTRSLPDVITDSAARVAYGKRTVRHLVIELGGPLEMSEEKLRLLWDSLVASGTTMHLIVPPDVDVGRLGELAERSGGSASAVAETVTGSDTVTAAIVNRHRIVATVEGEGSHDVGLVIDGQRMASTVDVAPAAPAPSTTTPAPSTTSPAPSTTSPAPSTTATTGNSSTSPAATSEPRASTTATTDASASTGTTEAPSSTVVAAAPSGRAARSPGSSSTPVNSGAILLLVLAAAAIVLWWVGEVRAR